MFVTGFWGPVLLPSLVFALFGISTSGRCFLLASALGFGSFITWHIYEADSLWPAVFIGTFVHLAIVVFNLAGRYIYRKIY
jgi:hypothetical protein